MAWTLKTLSRCDGPARGVAAIVLAVLLLSFSDALVKLAGNRFGLGQIVLLRSLVAAGLIGGVVLAMTGATALRSKRPAWVWARSLCLAGMWLSYYAALPSMSFTLAAACYYTAPVWMALMARFVLHAEIGPTRWAAIGLTMAGVLLAVDPRPGSLSPVLLLPLLAAGFYALAGIITWSRCREETAGAMAFNLNLCLAGVAASGLVVLSVTGPQEDAGFVLAVWPHLRLADWGLASLLGGLLAVVSLAVAVAYRSAPAPVVGVFDATYLGFAALWGSLLLAEPPAPTEACGIGLIAAGAILMNRRPMLGQRGSGPGP